MNTLPRAITAQVLADSILYHSLRSHWSTLMRSPRRHELTAAHHLVYLALIGKDWRRSFAPVTRRSKLENGGFQTWGLFRAVAWLHISGVEDRLLAPFDGLVTLAMLQQLRPMIPYRQAPQFEPGQFAAGSFPFDAYIISAAQPVDGRTGEADA